MTVVGSRFDARGRRTAMVLLLLVVGCGGRDAEAPRADGAAAPGVSRFGHELTEPPGARWDMVRNFEADLAHPRHPADGGGRAWLAEGGSVRRGSFGRWVLVYEAGELGVAVGGMISLQVPPFWDWGSAQGYAEGARGYTTATTDAEGVQLEIRDGAPKVFAVVIGGRALAAGERVTFTYGAGPAGVRADEYAERHSVFWVGVDGDGDGYRLLVDDSPAVDILPGPPAFVVATVTSSARPGETVRLTVAVLDASGSSGVDIDGPVRFLDRPVGVTLPEALVLAPGGGGVASCEFPAPGPGAWRLQVEAPGGLRATSNPLVVRDDAEPLAWADLHGHSNLSDGTGLPEDYFRYARDVAALDVAVLTDHDHWGMRFLDARPELWAAILEQTDAFHEPGRFVTLGGYEWTSWIHGHRHVLQFGDTREIYSSMDERYRTPGQLWDALRGQQALTLAHHSAGGPIPTDWSWRPDPLIEPVTEIVSSHGSSESADTPGRIYAFERGNTVRDVLDDGMRFGFVGSGDGHDGHPGLAHLNAPSGGLAALPGAALTRDGVLGALRARRCYATNGPRIVLEARLDGAPMGSTVDATPRAGLDLRVSGTGPLTRLELIRGGRPDGRGGRQPGAVVQSLDPAEALDVSGGWSIVDPVDGEYLYVRVVQRDGGAAWSSPFFIGPAEGGR